jgi:hypothetical protein
VRPFRLYLTASFIYFLVLSIVPSANVIDMKSTREPSGAAQVGMAVESEPAAPPRRLHEDTEFKRRLNRFVENPGEARERALHAISTTLPKALFVLVPVFALLMRLLYRKSGRFYAEHFLFALHFHAFAFLALAFGLGVTALLGLGRAPVMQLFVMGYLFLALRRVHGESRGCTAAKTAALYFGYGLLLLLTVTGTVMSSIYLAT